MHRLGFALKNNSRNIYKCKVGLNLVNVNTQIKI